MECAKREVGKKDRVLLDSKAAFVTLTIQFVFELEIPVLAKTKRYSLVVSVLPFAGSTICGLTNAAAADCIAIYFFDQSQSDIAIKRNCNKKDAYLTTTHIRKYPQKGVGEK